MDNFTPLKSEKLKQLMAAIEDQYDGEAPPEMDDEKCRVIAQAFYLLISRTEINDMMDTLIMLLANQDPDLDWSRHTIKNLARFLNTLNHEVIRTH